MLAPDFTLMEYHLQEEKSLSTLKGKPVMLTFWTSWCPDSQRDLAQKHKLYQSLPSEKLAFLTINVSGREGHKEDAIRFIQNSNYTFPVLFDVGTKTYDAYHCMGVPTTVLLNEKHEVCATYGDRATYMEIMKGLGMIVS